MKTREETTEVEKLRAELEQLRQTVARFEGGAEVRPVAQVVTDKSRPLGLDPRLASFYAAAADKWKTHPHGESWAIRNGYRKAVAGDFVETDGMLPDVLLEMAAGVYGDLVLYVCPREHQERRRQEAERRSAIAVGAPLPEFRGPDGRDATVRESNNGTGRQS